MKELSILQWNINQRGGKGGDIPAWIIEEVKGTQILVMTEFCTQGGRDLFVSQLQQMGYHCAVSENSRGNDVLIASTRPIQKSSWEPCYGKDTVPEHLRAEIDCGDGKRLIVFGVRIKSLDRDPKKYIKRKESFQWVLDQLKNESQPAVIAGDFNNNRRETINTDWSLRVMDSMLIPTGCVRYTPAGSSIYEESVGNKPAYEFPYDQFVAKGVQITQYAYDRDFTARHPQEYPFGRNFRERWKPGADNRMVRKIAPPYPDHAILRGALNL